MAFAGERQKCGSGPCCGGSCSIFADTFDRADADSLGANWTEAAGDFDIVSNQLKTTTANSRAMCNTAHPDSLTTAYVAVTMVSCGNVSFPKIIVNYVDASNYHAVVVGCTTTGAVLTFIKRTAGTDATLKSVIIGSGNWTSNVAIKVCMTPGSLICEVSGPSSEIGGVATIPHAGGYQVGLAVEGVVTSVIFDDFSFQRRRDDDHTNCPDCQSIEVCPECPGCSDIPPEVLKVVISRTADDHCDDCSDLNGTYLLTCGGEAIEDSQCSQSIDEGCSWVSAYYLVNTCSAIIGTLARYRLEATIYKSGAAYYVSVVIAFSNLNDPGDPDNTLPDRHQVFYELLADVVAAPNCAELFAMPISLEEHCVGLMAGNEYCDFDSATVEVSLP